jgi:sugar phosphate isomerase/epimerase
MKSSRRSFIKSGALAFGATALFPKSVLATGKPKKPGNIITGLQLYSVRDEMSRDPLGTLTQLSAMGYVNLEHAGYSERKFYGYTASVFKKILDDLGLKMISGHTVLGIQHWIDATGDFTDDWKYTVEDAAVLEQKYVISPWMDVKMRDTRANLMKYLAIFNNCGDLCNQSGMKFGYHNHDFEFSQVMDGEKLFDIMMRNIDPERVVIQLDIGNIYNGGAVALDVVKKYPGRFENIHVKDEIQVDGGKYESCILGEGIINCQQVVNLAAEIGGASCFIIEQEAYQDKTPVDCVKEDLAVMRKWGY